MSVSRDSIEANKVTPFTSVPVPEWGGDVFIKKMNGNDHFTFYHGLKDDEDATTKLLVRVICDEQGNRLYKDDEAAKLGEQPAETLAKLWPAALQANKLGKAEEAEVKKD